MDQNGKFVHRYRVLQRRLSSWDWYFLSWQQRKSQINSTYRRGCHGPSRDYVMLPFSYCFPLWSFFPFSLHTVVSEEMSLKSMGPPLSGLNMKNQLVDMSSAPAAISHLRWCFLPWHLFAMGLAGPWAPSAHVLSPQSAQHHGPKCRVRSPFPSSCPGSTSFSPLKGSEPCRSSLNLPVWPS